MKGRRSFDQNYVFGFPSEFSGIFFPRDNDIVSPAQFLRRQNCSLGLWKSNTPDLVVSKAVASDLCGIWDKTSIPHFGNTNLQSVQKKVERLLGKAKDVLKVPENRRDESELGEVWGGLFEMSLCPHRQLKLCNCPNCETPHPEQCDCSMDKKVPDSWADFLWDQRGPRKQALLVLTGKG